METISKLIYPTYFFAISPKIIKENNKLNFACIWKNKHRYIKRGDT